MKALSIMIALVALSGCTAMRQGTAFDGSICGLATDMEARQRLSQVIAIMPEGQDKERAKAIYGLAGVTADVVCLTARQAEGSLKP